MLVEADEANDTRAELGPAIDPTADVGRDQDSLRVVDRVGDVSEGRQQGFASPNVAGSGQMPFGTEVDLSLQRQGQVLHGLQVLNLFLVQLGDEL